MKSEIKCVVFDLDGTLVQSHITIYEALMESLKILSINAKVPREEFYKTIGMHFNEIFQRFNFEVPDFEEFISIYRDIYFRFISDSKLYNNVLETLSLISKNNFSTALLTTKGQDQADRIIHHFELGKYFNLVIGRRPNIPHKPNPYQLSEIIKEFSVLPSETIMVGDSELDIQCGKNLGAKTCAVTYGYRSENILKSENPDFIIDNISEIAYILNID